VLVLVFAIVFENDPALANLAGFACIQSISRQGAKNAKS
jgi:hypothetical protein